MTILDQSPRNKRFGVEYSARTLAAGVLLSTIALESVATVRQNALGSSTTDLVSHDGTGEQAIYVLPGCRSDGRFVADQLAPRVTQLGSTHTVVYPDRGFSFDAVRDQLLEARRQDDRPASFYLMSMGGMVFSHLLRDSTFRSKFGNIDNVVFDSSPSDVSDLTPHTLKGVTAAKLVPGISMTSKLYSYAMHRRAEKVIREHPEADDVMIGHLRATASTPLSAVEGQTRFIRETHFLPRELSKAAIKSMTYLSSVKDDVVDVYRAVDQYRQLFDNDILHVVDSLRPNPSHAAGVEYQDKLITHLRAGDEYADVVPLVMPSERAHLQVA